MSTAHKQIGWFFLTSSLLMVVILLPMYGIAYLNTRYILPDFVDQFVMVMFLPGVIVYRVLCSNAQYCAASHFSPTELQGVLYLTTALVYGYLIAFIRSWTALPKKTTLNLDQD